MLFRSFLVVSDKTYQIRVRMNDLRYTLTSKGLLTESTLDIVEDFGVRSIRLVQEILEGEIGCAESIAEMLSKDPAAV